MFCTKCGKQLDDGLKFCTACGAPVTVPKKPEPKEAAAESIEAKKTEAGGHEAAAAEAMASDETAVLQSAEGPAPTEPVGGVGDGAGAEAPTAKSFDLPDSALEPKTPEPASEKPSAAAASAATAVMPVVDVAADETGQPAEKDGGDSGTDEMPPEPSPKKTRRAAIIGICSAAAAVMIAAVGVLVVLDPFNPNAPIDSDAFPNDVIRSAVMDQLDADGDGRLSDEEAQRATALVFTSEGAEFVTEGEEVDVQAIRDRIAAAQDEGGAARDEGAQQQGAEGTQGGASAAPEQQGGSQGSSQGGSQGADAQEGPDAQGSAEQVPFIGEELAPFANLKTLVATDCDLTEVDLSAMPALEYVDLRENPGLATFDLSGNKNIKVLFCDANTAITGLEEAGLYYTDLLTGMEVSGKSQNRTIQVEYDTHARPVLANGVAYSYDETGRLVHAEQADVPEGAWFEGYEYGANGLLSAASAFSVLDVSSVVNEYAYGYDDAGRVTQFAMGKSERGSSSKEFSGAGEFAYLDGKLAAYKGTNAASSSSASNVATVYSIDEDGLLATACKDSGGAQTTLSCSYAPSGALSGYSVESAYLTGAATSKVDSTEYSEAGFPVRSAVTADGSPMQVSYECNADGYITSIQWGSGDTFMAGSTGKLSYVKRVGALADRAAERYVPVIRPALYAMDLYETSGWAPLRNWFQSTGFETPVTVYVYGPMDVANEQLGLQLNMLDCPNELALAAYDREHWMDGLGLSGAQPIEAAGVAELLTKAAQVPLPVPAQTFLNDPVYGPVVQEYLEAQKEANTAGSALELENMNKYAEIPEPVRSLLFMGAKYGSRKDKALDFAYVDLNADGVNELAVTFPSDYEYGTKDGKNKVACAAVYGPVDGRPQLIACGADRMQCWVTPDGHVVTYGGAAMYATIKEYAWSGTKADVVGGLDYMTSAGEGIGGSFELTMYGADGSEKASVVDYDTVMKQLDAIMDANPYAKLAWTPIPVA